MHPTRSRAFTLVEIMIVVVIIGLLCAMGIPAMARLTQKSGGTTVVNNLKQFSSAFEQYSMEAGAWPPDAVEQVVPTGMADRISEAAWAARLPGGHVYDWDKDVSSVRAAISIRPFGGNNSDPIFAEIDRALDDGNTATGNFRLVGDRYMNILQE
jgi:general secretion pathway protein G